MTKSHIDDVKTRKPKFKYWRLTQLFMALLATILLLVTVISISNKSDFLTKKQVKSTINAHLSMIAISAIQILPQTKSKYKNQRRRAKKQLLKIAKGLTARSGITQVDFFDKKGFSVINDESAIPITSLLPIGKGNNNPPLQQRNEIHIQELYNDKNELIGFLELTLDSYHLSQNLTTAKRHNEQQSRLLMLAALFLGIMLTKAFSRKHKFSRYQKEKIRA